MSEILDNLKTFVRMPVALYGLARQRMTLERAKQSIHERMNHRSDNFLLSVERNVYSYPRSPYLALLKRAGCTMGDLRTTVNQKGLEGTLHALRREGVYVTFEEFKGRKPIVRNGLTLGTRANDFDNPFNKNDFQESTGGSTGQKVVVRQDFGYLAERVAHEMITLDAYGLFHVPTIGWGYLLPAGPMRRFIQFASFGQSPDPWFVANGWRDAKDWLKYDTLTVYMLIWLRVFGMKLPMPRTVRFADALVIARAIHTSLQTNPRCFVSTGIGRAMRIANAAADAGLDLTGAAFRGGGEPITKAKVRTLERVGAKFIPNYAMSESGFVGAGCANPVDVSDVHLLQDLFALITAPHTVEGFGETVNAFNFTSLIPSAPKVMLNYQVDDYGIIEERACGCPLEQYGYSTHIRDIHSYSKLVGEGVTLLGSEMLRIVEDVLPTRFGGTPLDYQLMEEEDATGFSRLFLYISPRVEIADESEVVRTLLDAMRNASANADATRLVWQQANTIQVKRIEPIPTARGKMISRRIRSESQTQ